MGGCCSEEQKKFIKMYVVQWVRFIVIVLPLFLSIWRASELTTLSLEPNIIYMILCFGIVLFFTPIKLLLSPGCFEWARDNTGW